jgi:hypothetical protein
VRRCREEWERGVKGGWIREVRARDRESKREMKEWRRV